MSERYLHVTAADLRAAVEAGQMPHGEIDKSAEVEALLKSISPPVRNAIDGCDSD